MLSNRNFKLRDRYTGLFSNGGSPVTWSRSGKTWRRKSDLVNHLRFINERRLHALQDARFNHLKEQWFDRNPGATESSWYDAEDGNRHCYNAAHATMDDIIKLGWLPENWEVIEIKLDPEVLPGVPIREFFTLEEDSADD